MGEFLAGALTMAYAAIAAFFGIYWRKARDRLFAVFALAFLLLACERVVLAFVPSDQEGRHWIFLARLVAFALIIVGVIDKNRPRVREPSDTETEHPHDGREETALTS